MTSRQRGPARAARYVVAVAVVCLTSGAVVVEVLPDADAGVGTGESVAAVGAGTASIAGSPARPSARTGGPAPETPRPARIAGTPASQTYPFRPTSLTLPSGAVAAVEPAGVDTTGTLQVPADPSRLGWWTGGALVGEPFGGVVLAGHVDSRTLGLGVLVELADTSIGAEVLVGDETQQRRYRVVSVDQVSKVRLATDIGAFRRDVDHRLVLITCGGAYDRATQSYEDNVVVIALPVD